MSKVLFVGWDAADWKAIHPLMDAGRMPNLQRLVETGAMGRAATLQPALSPMLWTSIATGKRPFKHGIHGFVEPTPDGRSVRPVSNLSRTSKAVWNILNQTGKKSVVVGWWPSHPAEPIDGVMVSDHYPRAHRPLGPEFVAGWPLPAGAVHPPDLHATLAELRIHPEELAGPMLVPFLPALEKVDQRKDRRFSMLCNTIAECVSVHSAATWLLDNREWDFFAVYFDAIDHFCHGFMRYHPPQQPPVSDEDFEKYSQVVSTAYVLHDQMLGTLLAKARATAGDDLHVMLMSDHGFHPDHLRPAVIPDAPAGPAIEHSPLGVFVLNGPGVKRDEPLYGVSVLDAAPTLLALFGLPAGDDMDGRVVRAAFETPPALNRIPSWELVDGPDGRHPPHTRLDPLAAAEALEQLVALGYVEPPGADAAAYVEHTVRELRYNLMESLQDADRHPEAVEIARDLCRHDPDEQRYAVRRFASAQALGLTGEMREIVDDLTGRRRELYEQAVTRMGQFQALVRQRVADAGVTDEAAVEKLIALELNPHAEPAPDEPWTPVLTTAERAEMVTWRNLRRYQPPVVAYLQAQALTAERRWDEALAALDAVNDGPLVRPGLLLHAAELYRHLGRPAEADRAYRLVLEIDPDSPPARLGLARLALRRHDYAAAADHARMAVGKLHFFPMAHFVRGVARIGLGDDAGAAESFRTALAQNPHFPQAHLRLARLLRRRLNDPAAADEHLEYYRAMRAARADAVSGAGVPPSGGLPTTRPPEGGTPAQPEALEPLGVDEVVVVSGLPRSGTSMLMQMLAAGGMPILSDRRREADADNPRGYFELEAVTKVTADQTWVADARGKAVKVVAPLVCGLPRGHRYRVLLIERDVGELLDSQGTMIARRGGAVADSPERRRRLADEYGRVVQRAKGVLSSRPDVRLMVLRYDDVVRDPGGAAGRISGFVGGGLDVGRAAGVVDPALYRNRERGI